MRHLFVFLLICILAGCVTGEKVSANIAPGMSSTEIKKVLGKPDGFRQDQDFMVYKYTNRLISGWSWDRADYSFIFRDDRLVEYGAGEVRTKNVGGVHTVFLYTY